MSNFHWSTTSVSLQTFFFKGTLPLCKMSMQLKDQAFALIEVAQNKSFNTVEIPVELKPMFTTWDHAYAHLRS